jgi:methyl-accepting chemotaxis protein
MIVICENCGKKYRVDPGKVAGEGAKFRCRGCSFVMTIQRPPPLPTYESPVDAPILSAVKSLSASAQRSGDASGAEARTATPEKPIGRRRFGLTAKVIVVMSLVSLLPLLTLSGLTLLQLDRRMRLEQETAAAQVAATLANQVEEWIDKSARALRLVAETPQLQSMEPGAQAAMLKAMVKQYPWMSSAIALNANGMNIARTDASPLSDYSDRLYYKAIVKGQDLAWQTVIARDDTRQPALVLAVPIREGSRLKGVIATALLLDSITHRVAHWRSGKTGFAFLVDESGKAIAHPEESYAKELRNLSDHPLIAKFRTEAEGQLYFKDKGVDSHGHVQGTTQGWAVAVQQSEAEAFARVREALLFTAAVSAVTVLAVLLVAYLAGRAVARPIRKLTEYANRISVGEMETEIDVRSSDEIGDLAEAISRMQESIRLSIERLRRRRAAS